MSTGPSFLHSTYTKITFAVVLGFVGITAGIYVGNALVLPRTEPAQEATVSDLEEPDVSHYNELDARYIDFTTGDLFPLEDYWDSEGNRGNFETLLKDTNTIAIFVSQSCGPCIDLMKFWKLRMQEHLRPNVQAIACMDRERGHLVSAYEGLFDDMTVVYYDGTLWRERYNMDFTPVIIGIDNSGFVQHIQFGFDDYIDFELVDYFFDSK